MNIPVIYEDNHLLVVNKPVNIPVQQDISEDPDLLTLLKEYIREKYHKPGNVFLGLIHRLDRPASGCMVFARTSKAASRLSNQFRKRIVKKEYLAVVQGKTPDMGTLLNYLKKDRNKNTVYSVSPGSKNAKKAVLHYRTIAYHSDYSLVHIELETGRSHQIRVQFATAGYPLWGDHRYGSDNDQSTRQLALHSFRLTFEHPTRHENLTFECLPGNAKPWTLYNLKSISQEQP